MKRYQNRNIKKICLGLGQLLTLIGYSSELSDMAESDYLHPSYNLSHNDWLTPDTFFAFGGLYMIKRGDIEWCCCSSLCVDAG